jgi:hypothetical protein
MRVLSTAPVVLPGPLSDRHPEPHVDLDVGVLGESGPEVRMPVPIEHIAISQMRHPLRERENAHRWLRGVVLEVCRQQAGKAG